MEVKIKTETLPTRCEICHQSDRFDPSSNFCARCSGVPQVVSEAASAVPRSLNKATITDIEFGATIGMSLGLLIGVAGGLVTIPNLSGALYGLLTAMPVWTVHGAVVGLFIGESATITNAAEIGAVSKALATAPSAPPAQQSAVMRWLKALDATLRGAVLGFIFALVPALITTTIDDETFIWAFFNRLLIWTVCGIINGTFISILCRRRSDRRAKQYGEMPLA